MQGAASNAVECDPTCYDWNPQMILALDHLYGRILSAAFERANTREKDEIQKVLRAVISIRSPLSINGLSNLLKIKAENIVKALSSLHSVVYIPENKIVAIHS